MATMFCQIDSSLLSSKNGNTTPAAHPDRRPHIEFPVNATDLEGTHSLITSRRMRIWTRLPCRAPNPNRRGLRLDRSMSLQSAVRREHRLNSSARKYELQAILEARKKRPSEYRYTPGGADGEGDDASTTHEQDQLKFKRDLVAPMAAPLELSESFGGSRRIEGLEEDMLSPTIRRDPDLMLAIDLITIRLKQGGRLTYIGTGAAVRTSSRISLCTDSDWEIRLVAGGAMAVDHAARDAEDTPDAVADLGALMSPLTPSDVLIGVVTPWSMTYVLAGMSHARALGVLTVGFTYINWGAPGVPGVCECVVECDLRLESKGESSESDKSREIQLVLTKLSEKLGEYTRTPKGMVETGTSDERDKNVAHRPRTSARAIANPRTIRSRLKIPNDLGARAKTEYVTEQERGEDLPSLITPTLLLGNGHDPATSN
ncbi:hypothetical protein BD779DRAFT_1789547 [Infundibulicybe gibba]|nr:hypothetical protein BD779DRAFT_1789547 [Infundibulicybe gibba]